MKRRKMIRMSFVILLLWIFLFPAEIEASEMEEAEIEREAVQEKLLDEFSFETIDESVRELFPEENLSFMDTVRQLLDGELELTGELLNRIVWDQLSYVLRINKNSLIKIILIAFAAAVLSNFSKVFQNRQLSDISFYALYLLLIALSLKVFDLTLSWAEGGIEGLTDFMGVFSPVYFAAVSVAKGSVTAAAFYHLVLFLIYLSEWIIVKIILPMIHIYMMIRILDALSEETYLSKFAGLIQMVISWGLKSLLAWIIGLNVIQGMINPAIDAVKRSVVTRGAEAIPGVGDALGGMAEVAAGTAVLVKNGIGMTGAVIAVGICLVPLAQIGGAVLLYKLAAAVIQPISDPRIVGCVETIGEGCLLLMKLIFTTGLLFLLTIAVVTMVTGGN